MWTFLDALGDTASAVRLIAAFPKSAPATCKTQFSRWKKQWGPTVTVKAEKEDVATMDLDAPEDCCLVIYEIGPYEARVVDSLNFTSREALEAKERELYEEGILCEEDV